jgi:exosome complex component CSL4
MIKDGTFVFPGEIIATTEELLSGNGTYNVKNDIISGIIGTFHINKNRMSAEVKPLTNTPNSVSKGDIVLIEIKKTTKSMVLVDILHVAGKTRSLFGDTIAAIHISNLSRDYVSATGEKYRIGDIARAKVIQVKPSIKLSTVGPSLGVIKSYCVNCRNILQKKNGKLECSICGRVETRKVANDYGEGNLDKR